MHEKDAEVWARKHGSTAFKCTFSEHDMEPSRVMVRAWCHRMQFFYDTEMAAPPDSAFSFTPEVVASYTEPTELVDLAQNEAHRLWPRWIARIAAIRSIPRI